MRRCHVLADQKQGPANIRTEAQHDRHEYRYDHLFSHWYLVSVVLRPVGIHYGNYRAPGRQRPNWGLAPGVWLKGGWNVRAGVFAYLLGREAIAEMEV